MPVSIMVDEIESAKTDNIEIPTTGNGKSVIVQVDEVRVSVRVGGWSFTGFHVRIDFRTHTTWGSAEQNSRQTGGSQ